MGHYLDQDDMKRIRNLKTAAPEEFDAWASFDRIVAREDGDIPRKYRELIAVAVAHVTQCEICIDAHVRGAKKAGASKEELAEAILIAAALRAGGAVAHGGMALRLFDEAP